MLKNPQNYDETFDSYYGHTTLGDPYTRCIKQPMSWREGTFGVFGGCLKVYRMVLFWSEGLCARSRS